MYTKFLSENLKGRLGRHRHECVDNFRKGCFLLKEDSVPWN
jgi:hypothetical protein